MTTLFADIATSLREHYEAQAYGVPVNMDNMPWTPLAAPAEHHLMFVAWNEVEEAGFGAARGVYQITGTALIGVKVPIETGWAGGMDSCVAISEAFQARRIGAAELHESAIVRNGKQGSYYRYTVHLPFIAHETATKIIDNPTNAGNPDDVVDLINERFGTLVAIPQSLVTVYDNMPYDTPGAAQTWCTWSVRHSEGQGEIGTSRYTVPGQATANLYVPIESGTNNAYTLAGAIVANFRGARRGSVSFGSPSLSRIGRAGVQAASAEWWQLNVRCPYYFEYETA